MSYAANERTIGKESDDSVTIKQIGFIRRRLGKSYHNTQGEGAGWVAAVSSRNAKT